jgi:hypothetical protein
VFAKTAFSTNCRPVTFFETKKGMKGNKGGSLPFNAQRRAGRDNPEVGIVFTTNVIDMQKCNPVFDFKPGLFIFAKTFVSILLYTFLTAFSGKFLIFLKRSILTGILIAPLSLPARI